LSKKKESESQKLLLKSVYVSVSLYVQTDHQAWGTNQVPITHWTKKQTIRSL